MMRLVVLTLTLAATLGCSGDKESRPKPGPSPAEITACERHCEVLAAGQRPECDRGVIEAVQCKRAVELATQDCKRTCQPRK